jgi:ABC-type histidine transport system ATPase subunit
MADGVIEDMGTPNEIFLNPKSEKTRAFFQTATESVN